MTRSFVKRLELLPRSALLAIGLVAIAAIAIVNYLVGTQLAMNVFYLLPVMFVAWLSDSTADGLVAVLATFLVGPLEAYFAGSQLSSLPLASWNGAMRAAVFVIVVFLLTEVHRLVASLKEQSLSDELTGLANRRALLAVAEREIERSRRYRHDLSLAYLDIDNFKAVNDAQGHAFGDRELIVLAGLASASARTVDTVARLGGDEFVILMPETSGDAAAELVARLLTASAQRAAGATAQITVSVGLITFTRPPRDVEELLGSADALIYEAKAAGGNCLRKARVGTPTLVAVDGSVVAALTP